MKEFSPFRLDLVNQCLWRHSGEAAEQRILLPPRAFAMLCYLVEHAGQLVTQNEFLEALWAGTFVQPEVLKSHVRDIRIALADDPKSPRFIETLPRRGYRFIAPVTGEFRRADLGFDSPATTLVGREGDLRRLRESFQKTLAGERQIVFLTGEPGIGKTSLVDEFVRQLAAGIRPIRMGRGQCVEGYGGKEAYYPMLEALGQLCRTADGASIPQILAVQAPTWLVQFPAFVKRDQRETLQREILGATRERMLREIGEALEVIAAESPLLLVLEDLHWVDHSTVDLISALARRRRSAKLMLIGTYRPVDVTLSDHPLKALKQELLVHRLCYEIPLEPLEEVQVAEYLGTGSGDGAVPAGLAGLIYQHSEGNPLFMVTAVAHLVQRGLISRESGNWKLNVPRESVDLEVPGSLGQMIEAQIDRLSAEEQRVLEAASLESLGRSRFAVAGRAAAGGLEQEAFGDVCEALSRRHCILRSADPVRLRDGTFSACYEFVHALYREVCYRRIAPGLRAKLHRRLGEWAEAKLDKLDESASWLAGHFEQGGDWFRAIQYLKLAAGTAGRRLAPLQAALILEHALELAARLPEVDRSASEIEILEKLGAIYVVLFDKRAIQIYRAMADRAARNGLVDVEVRAMLAMALPQAWESTKGYFDTISRVLELSAHQDPLTRAETCATCLRWRLGGRWDFAEAAECRKAYEGIRASGGHLTARALMEWSYFHNNSSLYREALRCAADGLAVLMQEAMDNPYLSATYSMYQHLMPISYLYVGEWGNALREVDAHVSSVVRNGDFGLAQALRHDRAMTHFHALDFDGARAICESVLPEAKWRSLNRSCRLLAACADVGRGAHDAALEQLLTLRDEMERQPLMEDFRYQMRLLWALSEIWRAKGNLPQARLESERFLIATHATDERTWRVQALDSNAKLAIAEADLPRALDCMKKGLQEMDGFELPLAAWRLHETAFNIYERLGDRDRAESHLQLSRAAIAKLANSMPIDEPLRKIFLSAPAIRTILGDQAVT